MFNVCKKQQSHPSITQIISELIRWDIIDNQLADNISELYATRNRLVHGHGGEWLFHDEDILALIKKLDRVMEYISHLN